MSIKILKGGLKHPENQIDNVLKTPQTESTSDTITRNLKRLPVTIAKVAGIPGSIYESITGDPHGGLPNMQDIETAAEKITGSNPGAFKPQGTLEELGDMIVSDAPFLAFSALSGGLGALAPAVARSVGANVGIKGAEQAGFGPIGQIFGAILGAKTPEKLSSIVKSFGKKPGKSAANLLSKVKARSAQNYLESENILNGERAASSELKNKVRKLYNEVSSLNEKKRNTDLGKDIQEFLVSMPKDELNINKAKSLKKQFLNEAYSKNHEPYIKRYYTTMANDIRDWIYGLENQYGKGISLYKQADEIYPLIKNQESLERLINKSSELRNLFKQSPLLWPTTGAAFAGKKAIIPASRAIRFWKQPEVQQNMMKALESISTGADKEAIASLHKIGNKAQEFNVHGQENGPKIKVLKGGLKS